MKVKKTIRIRKENIRELKKLECVESIEQNGRDILVHLNPEYTEGKQEAVRDEYLVQWGSVQSSLQESRKGGGCDMGRVGSKKYYAPDGNEYDSREEYLYLQAILDDPGISCIHRQVTITAINPVWMLKPKQLKTKVKYERRSLLYGHNYTADFVYREGDKIVICDVKSLYTSKLREFSITTKAVVARLIAHNRKRHNGEPVVIFRKAIKIKKNEWKIVDYPPSDCYII